MKSKLRIILITSLVMIVGLGIFLWKMNDLAKKEAAKEEAVLAEERDLVKDNGAKVIDQIKQVDIEPLYLTGDKKNVITTAYKSVEEIYSTTKSAESEELLTDIKKNKEFSFEKPCWAYNPYGTNPLSMYLYFKSSGNSYCRYTISVKDSEIPDFTRTLQNKGSGNITKEHEYQIIGLVPGVTNYITLRLYNKDDDLAAQRIYQVDIPNSPSGARTRIAVEKGYSKTVISNGLYTVFADGRKGSDGKKHYAILQYDNSGVLRTEIPLNGAVGRNMQVIYDTLVFASSANQVAEINELGQVMKTFPVNGYGLSGEYAYDGTGSLFLIATELKKNASVNSKIIKIELETGETTLALDMDELLPTVRNKAVKRSKKAGKNWVNVNSIQVTGTNQLLVSSQTLSSIFKVRQVGSLLPKVDYIIGDAKLWSGYKTLKKKVLTKALPEGEEPEATEEAKVKSILDQPKAQELFVSQYGQNSMDYQNASGEGQYYLAMLNNNAGMGAGAGGVSYYYQYLVDETTKTYQLHKSSRLPQTKSNGNVTVGDQVIVYCNSDQKAIQEMDKKGKLIRKFIYPGTIYRVYKGDWKGFWFH